MPRVLITGVVAYIVLRPLLGLGHELVGAGLAWALHAAVGSGFWEPVVRSIGLDPVYTGAAIRAAGGVQVAGLAIAGPLGTALHAILPEVCYGQDHLASRAAFSLVAAPGAPALGRGLVAFGANVIWLAFGLWLFWRWRRRDARIALIGLLIQAQIGVNHLLLAQVGLADIDASGLPFALEMTLPGSGWLTAGLATLPPLERDLLVGGSLVLLGYASATVLVLVLAATIRLMRLRRRVRPRPRVAVVRPTWVSAAVSGGLALCLACSPVGHLGIGTPNWQMTTGVVEQSGSAVAAAPASPTNEPVSLEDPTPVSIAHPSPTVWQYVVNGKIQAIHGVGYNPQYANLSASDRAGLYQRDFATMRRMGINTIEGWFEGQFDDVTLDAAARNRIGVLMPFELNQDWDYTDPNMQATILARVGDYVEKYKDSPAVRMWAPGNENLHRILYAHWVSQVNDPKARARAAAFAAFLPKLVDEIHALDPDHPVVYRDAEDLYLNWITPGFAQSGGSRPWLVYGANVYSAARLQDVIAKWPNQWPGRALLISEFAPGGMGPSNRPIGFQQEWHVIRSRPGVVLGGLAYTWATNGPEDLDRVFGLVDPSGVPTDGALAALAAAYSADATTAASPPAGN
jgi:hypothetical protein